ncbi:hypothetical protein LEP1GSC193_1007 [Leptospira alstonii serovar Pingchang str. 80-412]|uniref:Uncharacterized protein n=2 Tax=Leptospira alstonii TaxID=28452 RepID=M6CWL8_9LEPT|nr:hypothetical protein LEP1GSC194_1054 [Leptospira alstonii serovar Sichuan str. 79601]EQA82382.1 hypothetical protein LEP1GSC193_1007 [Leptospira alstonii serovar Pingchang str. 80-412]
MFSKRILEQFAFVTFAYQTPGFCKESFIFGFFPCGFFEKSRSTIQ